MRALACLTMAAIQGPISLVKNAICVHNGLWMHYMAYAIWALLTIAVLGAALAILVH